MYCIVKREGRRGSIECERRIFEDRERADAICALRNSELQRDGGKAWVVWFEDPRLPGNLD